MQRETLEQDIIDAKIVADQAYKDMLDAAEWFRSRSETVEKLQIALKRLSPTKK